MTQITEEEHKLNKAIFDAGLPDDLHWEGVLMAVVKCKRANPTISTEEAINIIRIAYERQILDSTLALNEEVRRWRYNLVESGILDIEGKPLVF